MFEDDGMWQEIGKTVRYGLASNQRTARLCVLMCIAVVALYIVL